LVGKVEREVLFNVKEKKNTNDRFMFANRHLAHLSQVVSRELHVEEVEVLNSS
jgi:hypothetical protein